jgi:hypothetical protein
VSAPPQFSTHADLLQPFRSGSLPLGGIVVPATRPAAEQMAAVKLGAGLDVPVLVLCSGHARPYEVIGLASQVPGAHCGAVDMVTLKSYADMPKFDTEEFPDAIVGSYGDLSLKRNLGLLIGRLAGWKTLLFLDDDIYGLQAAKVRRTVGALGHFTAVGMPATDFPDNSVVCHARRCFVPQEKQDVFVSGSALAVKLDGADSFFPAVYNEDWLFFAPQLDRRTVTRNGAVKQKPYYPFDSPERAVRQEFGDVLAEGLVGYLHDSRLGRGPSTVYWRSFLRSRADLINTAIAECRVNKRNPAARDAIQSLEEAAVARSEIKTAMLDDYMSAWRSDLKVWRDYLRGRSALGGLDKALADLGLLGSTMWTPKAQSVMR